MPIQPRLFSDSMLLRRRGSRTDPDAGTLRKRSRCLGARRPTWRDPARLERVLPELIGGATPRAIRTHLKLNRPIYARTAAYGHFGRQPDNEGGFSWERDDLVPELKRLV